MRKIWFVLFATFAFISCEGPVGPQGPEGDPAGLWEEDSFVVSPGEWATAKGAVPGTASFYYFHQRDWPAMDEFAVERGIVAGYVEDFNGAYTALPYVFHDTDTYDFTVTTSLSFYKGGFEIQVTNSDFAPVPPQRDMVFRVIIFK
ncbi:MAG: hypothetical protein LBJ60_03475 [Tannerellaceae bacterium]|jgi:hypothetical protein|nr:hypothetical protein [Tannerellaceae bacterium]